MKALALTSFLLLVAFTASSQLDYFISIDADGGQPFSVMIGRKIWSSDAQGHLIIAQLKDSTYRLRVNFPRNEFPEQLFDITIGRRDRGYDLKKTGSLSWALYDWQRLELISAVTDLPSIPPQPTVVKRTDPLASLLAGTVNDSAVLLSATQPKPPPSSQVSQNRTDTPSNNIVQSPELVNQTTKSPSPPIQLLVDKTTKTGRQLVFAILEGEIMEEAIVLLIPFDTTQELKKQVEAFVPKIAVNPEKDSSSHLHDTLTQAVGIVAKDSSSFVKNTKIGIDQVKPDTAVSLSSSQPATKVDSIQTSKEEKSIPVIQEQPKDSSFATIKQNQLAVKELPKSTSDSFTLAKDSNVISGNPPVVNSDTLKTIKDTSATYLSNDSSILIKDVALATKDSLEGVKEVISMPKPNTVDSASVAKPTPSVVLINSDCLNFATDTDVDKLRVKLLDAGSQETRLSLVRKAFKAKCHASKQARALSEIFPTEEEKFGFLELAYPFISDSGNFKQLVDLFTQPEVATKFKKLVRL